MAIRSEVPRHLLSALPHLDVQQLGDRIVPFHPVHDEGGWRLWIYANDRLAEIPVSPVEGCYFATAPTRDDDLYFSLTDLIHRCAYWPDMAGLIGGIEADVQNAGAILSKLRLIHDHFDRESLPSRMVVTEIEYLFLTCRSIFDLLQEIVVRIWRRLEPFDKTVRKVNLPSSYRKMVLRGEKEIPMSAEEIAQRFALPAILAKAYADSIPSFTWLRDYRDLVAHKGHTPELVFAPDSGFAISKNDKPFSQMAIWRDTNSLPNDLGAVVSVVAHVLLTTFATCQSFAAVLPKFIQFPPLVAPKHRVFMRGPYLKNLINLSGLVAEPWYHIPAPQSPDAQ